MEKIESDQYGTNKLVIATVRKKKEERMAKGRGWLIPAFPFFFMVMVFMYRHMKRHDVLEINRRLLDENRPLRSDALGGLGDRPVVKKTCRRRQVARARRMPVHTMHCCRRRTSPPDCSLEEAEETRTSPSLASLPFSYKAC